MLYHLAQKALFATDPERAHELTMESLRLGHRLGATAFVCQRGGVAISCMGLEFPNPVGVAPGLDKNADYFEALGGLGFGFVEVGTVTPRPQPGNPRPRIFRLPAAQAMINRLGFNSKGVDYLVQRVRRRRFDGILGINIGKNADTPMEQAAGDYLHCLEKVYPHADYVTVNVSSPNTPNLRELQTAALLDDLLARLAQRRLELSRRQHRRVPLAVKVAPDLDNEALDGIAQAVVRHEFDAVIATNTTLSRAGVEGLPYADEAGGLSGAPLKARADDVLTSLRQRLPPGVALIGVGGITRGSDAVDKVRRGASLVQFYTGMVYRGPGLLGECLQALTRETAA
jgi:dihydroorotate dehydrogenase